MIKRSEYMTGKVTHDEYYGQFVTPSVTNVVKNIHRGSRNKGINRSTLK